MVHKAFTSPLSCSDGLFAKFGLSEPEIYKLHLKKKQDLSPPPKKMGCTDYDTKLHLNSTQSSYVHFLPYPLGKGIEPLYLTTYRLNNVTAVLQGWLWY